MTETTVWINIVEYHNIRFYSQFDDNQNNSKTFYKQWEYPTFIRTANVKINFTYDIDDLVLAVNRYKESLLFNWYRAYVVYILFGTCVLLHGSNERGSRIILLTPSRWHLLYANSINIWDHVHQINNVDYIHMF